jgi:diadenosine tetraphosphatase ApaH/serine/threonine PP2A family protein phosphatase
VRYLIVSDIHSNFEALKRVIDDARGGGGFDRIWQLGDLVGYGPEPGNVIDLLREYDHIGVAGNHDLAAIGELGLEMFNTHACEANLWTAGQLTRDHVEYLRGLPQRIEVEHFTLVHASPRDPVWEYVITKDTASENFSYFDTKRCLVGHSHLPLLCRFNGKRAEFFGFPVNMPVRLGEHRYIINPGSVGQPRDGLPTASYSIYDSEAGTMTLRRTRYDISATQDKMRECGLSDYFIERLERGH